MISGSCGAGKTQFVKKLLYNWNDLFEIKCHQIIFFYVKWQDVYTELKVRFGSNIIFVQGLPEGFVEKYFSNTLYHKVIVFDDQMNNVTKSQECENLFLTSRHYNMSILYLTHNIFNKLQRTIFLNCQFLVIFKNNNDAKQISYLAQRLYGHITGGAKKFLKYYNKSTSIAFGYLICDLRPHTEAHLRLLTDIFNSYPTVFPPII